MQSAGLGALDERESGYTRVAVPIEELEVLLQWARLPPNARVWIYVPNGSDAAQTPGVGLHGPSFRCPILQTYVDVCITGCLEVSEEYAIEFITSTAGWDGAWLNDRAYRFADGCDIQRSRQALCGWHIVRRW